MWDRIGTIKKREAIVRKRWPPQLDREESNLQSFSLSAKIATDCDHQSSCHYNLRERVGFEPLTLEAGG